MRHENRCIRGLPARLLAAGRYLVAALLAAHCSQLIPALAAQQWNDSATTALIGRAIERRTAAQADTALRHYRAQAHGFVFFLAQVGAGLTEPPRLIKADELAVEVYWRAPDLSKQSILHWRDGRWLPTDIAYHRDHLGIVTNNFGDLIRIGEGDEVRDVVHPLARLGPGLYDYALEDSIRVTGQSGSLLLYEVEVRPRSFARPLVVGTLYLDAATEELVRFRFSFTPAAYLDHQLEDISVLLENARLEQRFWLPYRQEIEIRRRATWLDFPARTIIRGRWEIGDYDFSGDIPPEVARGPAIGGLRQPADTGGQWDRPLADAIGDVAQPLNRQDMAAFRTEVERIAGAHVLSGLPASRPGVGGVSDIVHSNRVEGLTLGFGGVLGLDRRRVTLRPSLAFGMSSERFTGGLALGVGSGVTQLTGSVSRRVRDLSELPVISPLLNSLVSQEAGQDHGDYLLADAGGLAVRHRFPSRTSLELEALVERTRSLPIVAAPASGHFRPNPPLGAGSYRIARLRLERPRGGIAVAHDLGGSLTLEAGDGPTSYARLAGAGRWELPLGPGQLLLQGDAGWGSGGLPAYRSFVLGGRGTLLGERFRAFGGRTFALGRLEWRTEVPFPAISLGAFASTGRSLTLAPFIAAGWSDRPPPGLPWTATGGVRPVAGLALEAFMKLIRVEAGVGLRTGRVGVTVDFNREWWGIL